MVGIVIAGVIYSAVTAPEEAKRQAAAETHKKQTDRKVEAYAAVRTLHFVKRYNVLKETKSPSEDRQRQIYEVCSELWIYGDVLINPYDYDLNHAPEFRNNYTKLATDRVNSLSRQERMDAETRLNSELKAEAVVNANEKAKRKAEAEAAIPPETKVTVSGSKWTMDDSYDYVRGSVKNGSSETVSYWKATAKFYDKSDSVIDSEFTNSGETLLPGESKHFEIMHRNLPEAKTYTVQIDEVRFR
jgi:hypothetical protein